MSSFTFAQLHLKTVHCGETVTPAGPNVELLDSVQLNETLRHDRKMWILVGTEEPALLDNNYFDFSEMFDGNIKCFYSLRLFTSAHGHRCRRNDKMTKQF